MWNEHVLSRVSSDQVHVRARRSELPDDTNQLEFQLQMSSRLSH